MTENDNVKMTINIAGERFQLNVPFKNQEVARDAEQSLRQLLENWQQKNNNHSDAAILTRIAYQFAYFYQLMVRSEKEAMKVAEDCESQLSLIV